MACTPLSIFGTLLLLASAACATATIPGEELGGSNSAQTKPDSEEKVEPPGVTCTSPQTKCGGSCVDVKTSAQNCGACGSVCMAGSTCQNGFCSSEASCAADKLACGAKCIDPLTDNENCGACDRKCSTGVCTKGGCPGELRVRALIDGHSQLVLTGAKARWHHTSAAAPGLWDGRNDPTLLGTATWTPVWPQPNENYDCNCDSQPSPDVSAPLKEIEQVVEMVKVEGRGGVSITQQPTAANGYTLKVDFDDSKNGAGWYEVTLKYITK